MTKMRTMEKGKWTRGVLAGIMAVALAVAAAEATTLIHMDLEQMAATSTVVARVRAVASEARWDSGEIYTFTTFEVVELIKGDPGQVVTVRLIGGRVGSLQSTVDGVPRFAPGEEAFLFLEPSRRGELTVVSWVQGTFRVRRDPITRRETVTQDTSMVRVFDPATRQFRDGGVRDASVEQFRERLREIVARQGGQQ